MSDESTSPTPVQEDGFESASPDYALSDDALVLALDGFEGPIDLLLTLSREHKIDITKISILALAEQYLAFINRARELKLEIAADYLVMAAWLAYLKSRLLLPVQGDDEDGEDPAELAARLAFQLQRLEAMQNVAQVLLDRPRLGQDFFARGMPEKVKVNTTTTWNVTLFDLLRAYGNVKRRSDSSTLRITPTALYSMDQAVQRLRAILGNIPEWSTLEQYLPPDLGDPLVRRSAMAATFAATLELVREGLLDVQQSSVFAPIMIRKAPMRRLPEGGFAADAANDADGEGPVIDNDDDLDDLDDLDELDDLDDEPALKDED
ncbi:segregation and condensation protein A [Hwanghaeella sp.]|uniref:segregation and condensation protein A n=1 Tax=Hwanghaeella sp. TaxID=2605943 RepID=UPI003CCC3B41